MSSMKTKQLAKLMNSNDSGPLVCVCVYARVRTYTHTHNQERTQLHYEVWAWFLYFKLWKVISRSWLSILNKRWQRTTRGGTQQPTWHRHQLIGMGWSKVPVALCYARCWPLFSGSGDIQGYLRGKSKKWDRTTYREPLEQWLFIS